MSCTAAADGDDTELHWLEGQAPDVHGGATWGVPWALGAHRPEQTFRLATADGADVPVQTWASGYWPDGSIKWTAHAIARDAPKASAYRLTAGTRAARAQKVTVSRSAGRVEVSIGVITAVFGAKGSDTAVRSVRRGSAEIGRDGQLVAVRQESVREGADVEQSAGRVEKVEVEQDGPVRAVVRVEGRHRRGGRAWLPYTLRFVFFAGAESFGLVHTFVGDGEQKPGADRGGFLRGLGIRCTVPPSDQPYDRHIRFADSGGGVFVIPEQRSSEPPTAPSSTGCGRPLRTLASSRRVPSTARTPTASRPWWPNRPIAARSSSAQPTGSPSDGDFNGTVHPSAQGHRKVADRLLVLIAKEHQ
ncbi:hypothetical protein [Streptomyces sp. NPDC047043]|uniref:exo-rhamnogalacturonan lyase family protein n=1 Tax=Streptomyces sp. NPDC047043 TaxID=3154497 RepID=UPI0033EBFF46